LFKYFVKELLTGAVDGNYTHKDAAESMAIHLADKWMGSCWGVFSFHDAKHNQARTHFHVDEPMPTLLREAYGEEYSQQKH